MYTVDKEQPVYYYKSTETRRWKVKIHDLMVQNEDKSTYTRVDEGGAAVHYSEAAVDSFYRSILIPTAIFPTFIDLLHK
jgi:hypothetical protein